MFTVFIIAIELLEIQIHEIFGAAIYIETMHSKTYIWK